LLNLSKILYEVSVPLNIVITICFWLLLYPLIPISEWTRFKDYINFPLLHLLPFAFSILNSLINNVKWQWNTNYIYVLIACVADMFLNYAAFIFLGETVYPFLTFQDYTTWIYEGIIAIIMIAFYFGSAFLINYLKFGSI
jgi:hypothetical protein